MIDSKVEISFLMPAKNASLYMDEAIESIRNQTKKSWELIIIEDHSNDDTYDIAKRAAKNDQRISVYTNDGHGQSRALNHGYKFSNGKVIKFVDADDILHKECVDQTLRHEFDVACHNHYVVTNFNSGAMSEVQPNKVFLNSDFEFCLKYMMGITRWSFVIKRDIADKIFPIPDGLEQADSWISLAIKRFVKHIFHIDRPLYYYRQHSSQTFGGIYNFDEKIVDFRSKRKLASLKVLKTQSKRLAYPIDEMDRLTAQFEIYLTLMIQENTTIVEIFKSDLPPKLKFKLLGIKKIPKSVSSFKVFQHYQAEKIRKIQNFVKFKKV
ncbi:glycosyltransferase family 2 protein [Desulfobacter latus]|uniref:Glycosyltransferase family 2 protein n=1 Tax=Desulfobacter latus TaxID=2292 RepID=A0A850SWT6_9BACT|nr:glycosyltransferase family 2 protein [Desulfobacter latus]NWH05784.1 glycosyltransferase family 2 protein [Desulfobacter latus]